MDFDKYNPLKQTKPPLQHWNESTPVVLLSEYLKQQNGTGIRLYNDNGVPDLNFNPGLKAADIGSERWTIAENAAKLFIDAIDDLTELISGGKLNLPKKSMGPSIRFRNYG